MKSIVLLAALLIPRTTVSTAPPIQGAWIEWLGCQATVQRGPCYSGVLLYVPKHDYPFAVTKRASGDWNFQRASQ